MDQRKIGNYRVENKEKDFEEESVNSRRCWLGAYGQSIRRPQVVNLKVNPQQKKKNKCSAKCSDGY